MHKICLLVLFCLVVIGCNSASDPSNIRNNASQNSSTFLNYGNGLYYFPTTTASFANDLSQFLANQSCLTNLTITGDGSGAYGKDIGYFVVCR